MKFVCTKALIRKQGHMVIEKGSFNMAFQIKLLTNPPFRKPGHIKIKAQSKKANGKYSLYSKKNLTKMNFIFRYFLSIYKT